MVGHLLNSTYGCDVGKNSLLHGASICLRFSPGQSLIVRTLKLKKGLFFEFNAPAIRKNEFSIL